MPKKRYSPEQIIAKLREAEVELAKGQKTGAVCRKLAISEQTYYRMYVGSWEFLRGGSVVFCPSHVRPSVTGPGHRAISGHW